MEQSIQVVGLGLATLDVLLRYNEMPTWDSVQRVEEFGLDGGGMAGTAMVAASRLGVRAGFVGTAGTGYAGRVLMESITDRGVDASRVRHRSTPEGHVVIVYIDKQGERHFSGLKRWGNDQLAVDELDRAYLTSAEYLLVDGFHFDAAVVAARWMHEAGKKVIFDGGRTGGAVDRKVLRLLEHVDYLVCGSGYAPGLTGEADRWKAGRAALATGPSVVVMTEGADGCYTVTADDEFHTPAFPVDVLDTTGAGDVFHGAYAVGLLRGWPLRDVAAFSSAVSALKCTRLGGRAGVPTFDETIAFLRERGISIRV